MPGIISATEDHIREAAALLRDGELVAFPTETVYGLGAKALSVEAVSRIFQAKGRPATNPIIVHIADRRMLASVVESSAWNELAEQLATRFWPGPLTLVLKKSPAVPDIVTANGPTVAVRWPSHSVAQRLILAAGVPIAAPSANRSGELSPTTAQHVAASLSDRVSVILDGGPCSGGLESTVLDVSHTPPRLLRPGLISREQIEAVIGPIEVGVGDVDAALPSPGLLTKHYSPRTPLTLCNTLEEALALHNAVTGSTIYHVHEDVRVASENLYADLHNLDNGKFTCILVKLPPDTEAWLAVRDRLKRAAAS